MKKLASPMPEMDFNSAKEHSESFSRPNLEIIL